VIGDWLKRHGVKTEGTVWQSDGGSEFIGSWQMKGKSTFIKEIENLRAEHFQVPKITYNADVETVHKGSRCTRDVPSSVIFWQKNYFTKIFLTKKNFFAKICAHVFKHKDYNSKILSNRMNIKDIAKYAEVIVCTSFDVSM